MGSGCCTRQAVPSENGPSPLIEAASSDETVQQRSGDAMNDKKRIKRRYRLRYLNARGRAEVSRLMFNISAEEKGILWEDKRYSIEFIWQKDENGNDDHTKWPTVVKEEMDNMKAAGRLDSGMGQVPILDVISEVIDGDSVSSVEERSIGQSMAIERYVARICGLMGDACDDGGIQAAQIEQVVETVRDLGNSYNSSRKSDDHKQTWYSETLPEKLKLLEKSLPPLRTSTSKSSSESPWLVGSTCSYADVSLFALLCMKAGVKEWDPFIGDRDACAKALSDSVGIPRVVRALQAVGELETVKKHIRQQPDTER